MHQSVVPPYSTCVQVSLPNLVPYPGDRSGNPGLGIVSRHEVVLVALCPWSPEDGSGMRYPWLGRIAYAVPRCPDIVSQHRLAYCAMGRQEDSFEVYYYHFG